MPRKKSGQPTVVELKKELRSLRGSDCAAISKMKKAQVEAEISRLKGRVISSMSVSEVASVEAPRKIRLKPLTKVGEKFLTASQVAAPRKIRLKPLTKVGEKFLTASQVADLNAKKSRKPRVPKLPKLKSAKMTDFFTSRPPKSALAKKARLVKGSAEAKAFMASIRAKRMKKV
jgi:hypothetical protein